MSNDHFTEITHQSWLGRIGGAIVGVLFGTLFFIGSFPLLFWNEGRSVKEYKSLQEGAHVVVSVDSARVDPAKSGKLIHLTGNLSVSGSLHDKQFGISTEAVKLKRVVEMYQWKQSTSSRSQKKLGGGEATETTYTYEKAWSDERIPSEDFKQPANHQNPTAIPYPSEEFVASPVTVGAFTLSSSLLDQLTETEPLALDAKTELPVALRGKMLPYDGGLYQGQSPDAPQIGDTRVHFEIVKPGPVSILAKQGSQSLEPYPTKAGNTIERLETGTKSAKEMFTSAKAENNILTIALRVVGFLLMFIGLALITHPLSVVADVLPFVGNLVGAGTGFVSFLSAVALSSLTIAVAWIFYRPLLAVALIAVTVGSLVLIRKRLSTSRATR